MPTVHCNLKPCGCIDHRTEQGFRKFAVEYVAVAYAVGDNAAVVLDPLAAVCTVTFVNKYGENSSLVNKVIAVEKWSKLGTIAAYS